MTWRIIIAVGLCLLLGSVPASAGAGGYQTEDPLEPRVKSIATQLRCPVCQGETIYDSHSSVATEMKALIKEKLAEGKDDPEIIAFFVERYGEFVLMEPRKSGSFLVIWLFPALAILIGSAVAIFLLRRRSIGLQPAVMAGANTDELIRQIERLKP